MEWKTLLTTELQKLNAQEINEVRNTLWKSFSGDFKIKEHLWTITSYLVAIFSLSYSQELVLSKCLVKLDKNELFKHLVVPYFGDRFLTSDGKLEPLPFGLLYGSKVTSFAIDQMIVSTLRIICMEMGLFPIPHWKCGLTASDITPPALLLHSGSEVSVHEKILGKHVDLASQEYAILFSREVAHLEQMRNGDYTSSSKKRDLENKDTIDDLDMDCLPPCVAQFVGNTHLEWPHRSTILFFLKGISGSQEQMRTKAEQISDYSVLYDDIKGTWSNQRRQSACCKFVAIDKGCCPIKNSMPDIEDYASYCFEKEKCPSNDTFKRPHKLYLAKVERKHKKLKMVEE